MVAPAAPVTMLVAPSHRGGAYMSQATTGFGIRRAMWTMALVAALAVDKVGILPQGLPQPGQVAVAENAGNSRQRRGPPPRPVEPTAPSKKQWPPGPWWHASGHGGVSCLPPDVCLGYGDAGPNAYHSRHLAPVP